MANQPEKKFIAGSVSATLWKNTVQKDGKEFSFETVSLERSFKDSEGNWKSTNALRVNDIPKATLVLNKAYEYLNIRQ